MITEEAPIETPLVALKTIAGVGPEGRRIRDAYETSDMPTQSGRKALWYHKTDVTQTMLAKTDVYIEPKASKRSLADKYWGQRSNMLLPHRLWLPLARVACVILPEPAVGSIWTPCRPDNPDISKPLCLYLNSTVGLLSVLGSRDNRKPSYPSFSLDTLRTLRVPNLSQIGTEEQGLLTSWFNWLQNEPLLPLPQMHNDPVRKQIDDAVCKALGFDPEWVATIRRELAKEPSVTDQST